MFVPAKVNKCKLWKARPRSLHWLIRVFPSIQGKITICAGSHIIVFWCRGVLPPCIYHLIALLALKMTTWDSQRTCLTLHFHPFFPSCGHLSAKVAFRAAIIVKLKGYSTLNTPSCFSIVATIAHPQSGECFKCSAKGSSSSSHPSRDLWQRKHATLSGLVWRG